MKYNIIIVILFLSLPFHAFAEKTVIDFTPIIATLEQKDINGALILLNDTTHTTKVRYLIKEVAKVAAFERNDYKRMLDKHRTYQNIAIGYHNLFVFLKRHHIHQKYFYSQAKKLYALAKKYGGQFHKEECTLLYATLLAVSGNTGKAARHFKRIQKHLIRGDFESTEYLASYYAAMNDPENTIQTLKHAYDLNPSLLNTWLGITDDFYLIENNNEFKQFIKQIKYPTPYKLHNLEDKPLQLNLR